MTITEGGGILLVTKERGDDGIHVVSKSSIENGSEAQDTITREKGAPKQRCNGGMITCKINMINHDY